MKILEKLVPLVEMANLRPKITGLSNQNLVIYTSTKQGSHGPRVKVFEKGKVGRTYPNLTFSIEREPKLLKDNGLKVSRKDLQEIQYFIWKNYAALMWFWNSDSDNVFIDEFLDKIDSI